MLQFLLDRRKGTFIGNYVERNITISSKTINKEKSGEKAVLLVLSFVLISSFARAEDVTIEFIQWWASGTSGRFVPCDYGWFQFVNPGIKVELISGLGLKWSLRPDCGWRYDRHYLSDVVGLDGGAWVNDSKQGAIAALDDLMSAANCDASQSCRDHCQTAKAIAFPVASFVYPPFHQS